MAVTRTQEEIDDVLDGVMQGMDSGSRFPGMSYEQGVDAALRWVTGDSDEDPYPDE